MSNKKLQSGIANSYLAKPKSGKGKGVLVLHAWWGLNPFIRKFCDRLAKEGFVALAPDLYRGATASTIAEAKKLRSTLERDIVAQEIAQAAAHLGAICGAKKRAIGVVGFSLGGLLGALVRGTENERGCRNHRVLRVAQRRLSPQPIRVSVSSRRE